MKPRIDPITTEVIRNQIHSIVDEMAIALMKSAYSTNIKERRDLSAAVFDRGGKGHRAGRTPPPSPGVHAWPC